MDEHTKIHLLREMLRIRRVEETIAELYPEEEMRCPVHLCIGQEAVPAGACAALGREDYVFSAHRSHGHYLAKGGDLAAMLAEIYGKATGCCAGKGGSMHLVDLAVGFLGATPIVGGSIAIAVGAAFGVKLRGEHRVVATFFGDGATEEGTFCESLNFAALHRLPVVFICENNGFSVYSPLSVRQPPGRELRQVAEGHGVEAFAGDGNDPMLVRQRTAQAVEKARTGGGPTFLEFQTYRWREHCGPGRDDDLGYRTCAEVEDWMDRCPIAELKQQLSDEGQLPEAGFRRLEAELEEEIEQAVTFAKESPFPSPQALLGDIFAPAAQAVR